MSKTLTIIIGNDDLKTLKTSGYLLCIAKGINGQQYDIVWRAFDKYLHNNTFSWTPDYKLFIATSFKDGATLKNPSSTSNAITIGQQITLDSFGIFSSPITGQYANALEMINNYDTIFPGVIQSSAGIDGTTNSTPAYISQKPSVKGVIRFQPVEKLLVWFAQDIQTGTMFSVPSMIEQSSFTSSQSFAIEVDMTKTDTATIMYENSEWSNTA